MRKVIGLAVLSSVFTVWACSSSSTVTPANNNNGGDDSGSSSSGGGDDSGSGGGSDAGQSCSMADISAMAGALGFDGGLDGGATGACIQNMCANQIAACMHESCAACQTPIISCATSNCVMFDADIPKPPADAGGCDAPGPTCAALAGCCAQVTAAASIVTALSSYATMCTTNSKSCDEPTCAGTIAAVNQLGMGLLTCKGPDAGP